MNPPKIVCFDHLYDLNTCRQNNITLKTEHRVSKFWSWNSRQKSNSLLIMCLEFVQVYFQWWTLILDIFIKQYSEYFSKEWDWHKNSLQPNVVSLNPFLIPPLTAAGNSAVSEKCFVSDQGFLIGFVNQYPNHIQGVLNLKLWHLYWLVNWIFNINYFNSYQDPSKNWG